MSTDLGDVLDRIITLSREESVHSTIEDPDRQFSYAELIEEVASVAAELATRGVGEGDRVVLFLPNSADFVVAALATMWLGAIFVPLAVTDPATRLATVIDDCSPALIITSDTEGADPTGHLPRNVDQARISSLRTNRAWKALIDAPRRPAYMIYTSGTTGTPKGVLIGTEAFASAIGATISAIGLTAETRTLCVSPFHFDGSYANLFSTLCAGGTVVIRPRESLLFPRAFFNTITRERITYSGFTPSYLRLLLSSPQITELRDSSLEVIALGGESPSVGDLQLLRANAPALRVFNRYGPTETAIAVSHIEIDDRMLEDGVVPIGVPHPEVSFFLVDDQGGLVEGTDHVAELYIGGRQLMERYWNAPQLTNAVLRDDVIPHETVYRSGDLVYRDRSGRYVYAGRADRVIKRSGVRISLVELGESFKRVEDVETAACILFDNDGDLGIAAFVVVEGSVTAMDIRVRVLSFIPENMMPNRIELVDTLPLNRSNKLDERQLLSMVGLQPVHSIASPSDITS